MIKWPSALRIMDACKKAKQKAADKTLSTA